MTPAAVGPSVGPRTWRPDHPVDLALTLGPLQRGGPGDPTVRIAPSEVWRATRTPAGIATLRLTARDGTLTAEAWGPGSEWALEQAPTLLGGRDDVANFSPRHRLVADLHRRFQGLRILRTEAVFEAIVPTVLEQKVMGKEARLAYRQLVERLGDPAPGPPGLIAPPAPATLAAVPYWGFHAFGVERRRATTLRLAAASAARLEEIVCMDPATARARLTAIPGLGAWSAAEVAQVALGDADAVSMGDYHLPHLVCWAFDGTPRGTEARMLELLEPYRGHRARVIRLLLAAGIAAPRYGPRLPLRRIARL